MALVSMAVAAALGATSMSDIEVMSQLGPVLGDAPSDSTIRRTLDLAALAPARPPRIPRTPADPEDQPRLAPLERSIPHLLAAALSPASTRLTSTDCPATRKEDHPGAVGAGAAPETDKQKNTAETGTPPPVPATGPHGAGTTSTPPATVTTSAKPPMTRDDLLLPY